MAPEVDPALGLAMAMQAGPGRFALLLGSGVSMPSGIPTGWGVVNDLLGKLAVAEGAAEVPEDPVRWFTDSRGTSPDYSSLLEALAPSSGQRRDLLSGYFERSETDREAGDKLPTVAHHKIAELVARGIVRVIVTTNFDRLLEQAIQAAGINPIVVATPDAARGTIPLAHTRCTVIKVHGDYLDPDIKNTVGELESYDPLLDSLLDRVFDDYGLVVCGWSATWDPALRNAICRSANRRYSAYWATVGELSPEAERVVAQRDATMIRVQDADSFFTSLVGRIDALDDLARRGLAGVELVAAQAKRLLPDPAERIRLADLAMDAVEQALKVIDFDGNIKADSFPEYLSKAEQIESAASGLVTVHATIGAFAERVDQFMLLRRSLERLTGPTRVPMSGSTAWIELRGYPALLGLYAAGIGTIAHENWPALGPIVTAMAPPHWSSGESAPVTTLVPSYRVLDAQAIGSTFGDRRLTPVSDYLCGHLAPTLRPTLRLGADDFQDIFDMWEYLLGVLQHSTGTSPTIGRWAWRTRKHVLDFRAPVQALLAAREVLLSAGAFGGSAAQMEEKREGFDRIVEQNTTWWS